MIDAFWVMTVMWFITVAITTVEILEVRASHPFNYAIKLKSLIRVNSFLIVIQAFAGVVFAIEHLRAGVA